MWWGMTGLWLAGHEGMEKNVETTILGYLGFMVQDLEEMEKKMETTEWVM